MKQILRARHQSHATRPQQGVRRKHMTHLQHILDALSQMTAGQNLGQMGSAHYSLHAWSLPVQPTWPTYCFSKWTSENVKIPKIAAVKCLAVGWVAKDRDRCQPAPSSISEETLDHPAFSLVHSHCGRYTFKISIMHHHESSTSMWHISYKCWFKPSTSTKALQRLESMYPTREALHWSTRIVARHVGMAPHQTTIASIFTGRFVHRRNNASGLSAPWHLVGNQFLPQLHRNQNGPLPLCTYEFLPALELLRKHYKLVACLCDASVIPSAFFTSVRCPPPPSAKVSSGSKDFCVFPPRPMDFFESRLSSFRKALL